MSHLGRPKEGVFEETESLRPVAEWLGAALGKPVRLLRDYLDGVDVAAGEIVLLENCRMNVGEGKDDAGLSARYAALCDVFVMDAFGTAHRAQASTHGVIRAAKVACGGPLLMAELDALAKALEKPARPLLAIVAGSKVSTKLALLDSLIARVDQLIVGGGIANTFIAAAGHGVGKSLVEMDLLDVAKKIIAAAKARGAEVPIPVDASDFRLMDRKVVDALKSLPERNRFMKGLYAWVGFRNQIIPYVPNERHAGRSSFSLRGLSRLAFTGVTAFTNAPLRLWSAVGIVIALFAIGFGLWIVVEHFVEGHDVPGWATLVAMALALLKRVRTSQSD